MKYLVTFFALCSSALFGAETVIKTEPVIKIEVEETPNFYEYHNRMVVFSPFHQAYERIKPNDLYVGVEAYLAKPLVSGHQPNPKKWIPGTVLDGELRLGYNYMFAGREHFTPIVGVGVFNDYLKQKHALVRSVNGTASYTYYENSLMEPVVYGTLGFLFNHEFNDIFNLGLNFKGMMGSASNKALWGDPVIGYDLSVPITFRFGRNRHWDLRIEPFNTFLHGHRNERMYAGFRNAIGYRF